MSKRSELKKSIKILGDEAKTLWSDYHSRPYSPKRWTSLQNELKRCKKKGKELKKILKKVTRKATVNEGQSTRH